MSKYEQFRGVFPPLVTPLDSEGKVDEAMLRMLVNRTIEAGVNGLVILGTAGEGPVIEREQRSRAIKIAVHEADGRVPIMAGTGDLNTPAVQENNRKAAELGAQSALVIPPFYFPQNQKAVVQFFKDIASDSPIPIVIYNFPQISKIYLEPASVEELSREPNIIGIKDSSANFVNFQTCVGYQSDSFIVYQGVGALTAVSLLLGCKGFISPVANIDPQIEVDLYRNAIDGNYERAFELQERVNKIISLWRGNSVAPAPSIMKALMGLLGVCDCYPCSPSPKLEGADLEVLKKKLEELNLL